LTLQRKRHLKAVKKAALQKSIDEAGAYAALLAQRIKEKKDKVVSKRRLSSIRKSGSA
jgi:hypothetical protein